MSDDERCAHQRFWVIVMWVAIALFPVAVAKYPTLDHALFWLFAPFRDHLSATQ